MPGFFSALARGAGLLARTGAALVLAVAMIAVAPASALASAGCTSTNSGGLTGVIGGGPGLTVNGFIAGDVLNYTFTNSQGNSYAVLVDTGSVVFNSNAASSTGTYTVVGSSINVYHEWFGQSLFNITCTPAPAPVVDSLVTTSGSTLGGTSVVITGANFRAGATVSFGGSPASVVIDSTTQITATTPAHAAGLVDVVVASVAGSTTASGAFTFQAPAPNPTFFSPSVGVGSGGQIVTIQGSGFIGATGVSFGGTPAAYFTVNDDTQITAATPVHAAGDVSVAVTGPGGAGTAPGVYGFVGKPTVTAVSPAYGSAGDVVTITGSNFVSGQMQVAFGGAPAGGGVVDSNTFTAIVPAGSGAVVVTVAVRSIAADNTPGFTYGTPPVIGTSASAAATVGAAYSHAFTATGGASPVTFAVTADALPAGLTLSGGGILSGTPTAGGTFDFTVTASDAATRTSAQAFSLTVGAPTIMVNPENPANPTAGQAYSRTFTATGGTSGYSFAVTAGAIPPGLSLSAAGEMTGTPTGSGLYDFTITATDSSTGAGPYTGSRAYSLLSQGAQVTTTPATLADGAVGQGYSQTLAGSGGTAPYSFIRTGGALPAGLSLDAATGTVSGAPTESGDFSVYLQAVDSTSGAGPHRGGRSYSFSIAAPTVTVTTASLADGKVGQVYSAALGASGGSAPYSFAVTAGALPVGLTLAADGTLSGAPTAGGGFTFTVTATDATTGLGPYTAGRAYSLTIDAATLALAPAGLSAAVGTAYSASVSASGGTGPYSYAVSAGGAPTGLTLAPDGTLSGTPTAGGTFDFTVTAIDASGGTGPYTASRAYSVTVAAPTIAVAPASLSAGAVGAAYNATISASSGTGPYSYAVTAGALPGGLSLAADGTLSGAPSASGSFNFTVTATDSSTGTGPYAGSRAYSLTIGAPTLALGPDDLASGTAGAAYTASLSASGGTGPYSYAVTVGALPAGLSLASDGTVSGTPTASVSAFFLVTVTDSSGGLGPYTTSRPYTLNILPPTLSLTPASLSAATVGQAYSASISASGGIAPYSYGVVGGELPPGLSLSSDGVLSGAPTAGGDFSFTVTAADSTGGAGPSWVTRTYSLSVAAPTIVVTPSTLPDKAVGAAYSATLSASGGTGPYSYAVTDGALPAGLALGSDGALSGAATASGAFNFTVTATDSSGGLGPYTGSRAYSLTIDAPTVALTPASLSAGSVGATYSASLSASGGTAPYSYAVTAGALPAGLSLTSEGVLAGAPTAGGTFDFTATATDASTGSGPYTASRAYSLTISAPTLALAPASLADATAGALYSASVSATGGTAPYGYAVTAGALPAGLSLASNGALAGTPTASGAFSFTVTATDASTGSGPYTASRAYGLTVGAPTIALAPASLPGASVATAYSRTLTASGGVAGYSYAVTAGALPAGMTLSPGGLLSGASTAGGTFNFTVTATDSSTGLGPHSGARAYSLVVGAPTVTLTPAGLPSGAAGVVYSASLSASGGIGPYSYAVTGGALPAGLSLAANGALTGTPTVGGDFEVTVTATDASTGSGPYRVSRAYGLTIAAASVTITPASLPSGKVAAAYSAGLSASGGVGPYSYAVTAGALPAGLSLASDGSLSGTPTAGGAFNVTISATNSSGGTGPFTASRAYALTIAAPTLAIGPDELPAATASVAYSRAISATGGVGPYSYAITAGAAPAGLTLSGDGLLSGTPGEGGRFTFTVRATDSAIGAGPYSRDQVYRLTVEAPAIAITPSSLPGAAVGVVYSQALGASGGAGPYSFAIIGGSLPAGITLSASGALSGTTVEGGTFPIAVSATDSSGGTGPFMGVQALTLEVAAPTIALTPAGLPAPALDAAYSQALSASGGTAPYSFAVTDGALPAGLSLSTGGILSGTPTAHGAFSFTVAARDGSTGAGPYSQSRTYGFTIAAPPPPPVAAAASASVAYNAPGQALDLTASISGSVTGIAVASDPSHGSVSVAGLVATYVPASGYSGPDSFTYTATGPGGTSGPATVSLTVAAPPPPAPQPASSSVQSGGETSIPVVNTGGPASGLEITDQPDHGTITVGGARSRAATPPSGFTLTYTPNLGYAGADSFQYVLTGPGGTSAPVTVNLTVTAQATPVGQPIAATVLAGASTTIAVTEGATGGPFTAVAVASPPAQGTAVVSGQAVVYTAPAGFSGATSFTYTLTNSGGTSASATVSVTVNPRPAAAALTATTMQAVPVSVNLAAGASGGPFTAAAVVSMSPAGAGTTALVSPGEAFELTFTPADDFIGVAVVTYTLSNAYAVSAPATLTITVQARPDPSADPDVRALLGAQDQATRRFVEAQVGNFGRRLEQLHGAGAPGDSLGLSFNFGDYGPRLREENPILRTSLDDDPFAQARAVQAVLAASSGAAPEGRQDAAGQGGGGGRFGLWTTGVVDLGQRSAEPGGSRIDFTTSGVSLGADTRISDRLVVGAGAGFGLDKSRIGGAGGRSRAESYVGAFYASWRAADDLYVDTVLGAGMLGFESRRTGPGSLMVSGARDGKTVFGSLAVAWDRIDGPTRLSPYGRLTAARAKLDAYVERGDPIWSLAFAEQDVDLFSGAVGLRGSRDYAVRRGVLTPRYRAEYRRQFDGADAALARYADLLNGPSYAIDPLLQDRDSFVFSVGAEWRRGAGAVSFDYEGGVSDNTETSRFTIHLQSRF